MKLSQIGSISRQHCSAEDEDYLKSVFDTHSIPAKDSQGNATGVDILLKDNAYKASLEIINKWNDIGEPNARAYLDKYFA